MVALISCPNNLFGIHQFAHKRFIYLCTTVVIYCYVTRNPFCKMWIGSQQTLEFFIRFMAKDVNAFNDWVFDSHEHIHFIHLQIMNHIHLRCILNGFNGLLILCKLQEFCLKMQDDISKMNDNLSQARVGCNKIQNIPRR